VVTTRAFFVSRPLLVVSIGLVALAAACAGWFGARWAGSPGPASAPPAGAGSAGLVRLVLQQGERDVQSFNTLSYTNLAQGLASWQASSTGALRSETTSGWSTFAKQVSRLQTTSTATVLDAALTSLDQQNGTADIIVALQVTVTAAKGSPAVKRERVEGTLAKTATGWKLSSLGLVPVGTT
jgi:Mce-associated membrane protein